MPSPESTVPLTAAGANETRPFGFSNRTVWFAVFRAGASDSCSFHVQTHFGDSAGESTTSSTSSMKGGNSGNNGSDLDKGNILKSTFDTLIEKDHKAFEVYHANLEELFLLHCEVMQHGTVLKDATPIIFNKPEVIPEVQPDPSPSRSDIQVLINSTLERQVNCTDELPCRSIEEWDRKKLDATSANPSSTCDVSFTQTNPHTSGPSAEGTSMPNPSAQLVNHFHNRTTIEGSAPTFGMPQQTMTSMFR
jgi:hypothetical protein